MTSKRHWIQTLLGLLLLGRFGCTAPESPPGATISGFPRQPAEAGTRVEPHGTSLWVHIVAEDGQTPLSNVAFFVGERWRTSDGLGNVFLDDLYPGETMLGLRSPGYVRLATRVKLDPGLHGALVAPMKKRATTQEVTADQGGVVDENGARLTVPPGVFENDAGMLIQGPVDIALTSLNPTHIETNFLGKISVRSADGSSTLHRALALTDVFFSQNDPVRIGSMKKVQLEIPLPMMDDLPALNQTVALARLDLNSGLWERQTSGTLVASSAPSGLSWQGDLEKDGLFAVIFPNEQMGCVKVVGKSKLPLGLGIRAVAKNLGFADSAFVGDEGEVRLDAPVSNGWVELFVGQANSSAIAQVQVLQGQAQGCVNVEVDLESACGSGGTVQTCKTEADKSGLGREVCNGLEWSECSAEWFPRVEICNGLDDDSDGFVDDEVQDAGWPCQTDIPTTCGRGVIVGCAAGKPICQRIQAGPPCCETDADCGGPACVNHRCEAACSDGQRNGAETDVDCGGEDCTKCGVGDSCIMGPDCTSKVCTGNVCQVETCMDAIQNQTETDVDCGGVACLGCGLGKKCEFNSDCASSMCSNGLCN